MPAPEFLGPYRIVKTIGRGGMGTVYSAVEQASGQRVAVKLIAHAVSDDSRFRDRFTSEIKSLASLQHPGIVRFIHSHIDEDGQIFYSMELVEGESLQSLIRREKKIDWSRTIDYAIQICSALKHAHDAGVIHRDLKPANLMLTQNGKIKLVDFGIAKLFGDSQQTRIGSILGTADYMAPEQAGTTNITPRTDLYALGNVMYAMLAGRPPFTGKNATEVIESLKRDRVTPLDLIDPILPDELVELVHHLLQKDPANRPPTALVVMKRLQSMKAGLARFEPANPDDIPTHVPNTDPGADTSSTGLPSDPVSATNELRAEKSGYGTVPSDPGEMASPTHATVIARGGERTLRPDGPATDEEVTRQEAVTDFHLAGEHRSHNPLVSTPGSQHGWQHWFGVTVMIGVLAAGGGLFWYATRPPSADQLYGVASSGDRGAMATFLRRFPDDPRWTEIQNLQLDSRLAATVRRLATQTSIGVVTLSAAEESFLAALRDRTDKPEIALRKTQQWLSVYDGATDGDESLAELIELAKHASAQLSAQSASIDPRVQELLDGIRRTVQSEDSKTAILRLKAIIQTFGEQPWAVEAVEQAKQALMKLESES